MSWSPSPLHVQPPCGVKRLRLWFPKAIRSRKLRRDSRFHYLYGYGCRCPGSLPRHILVVFSMWRWTAIDGTLSLVLTASRSQECLMTFIAVRCPPCQSEQIVKRGKTGCGTQRYLCPVNSFHFFWFFSVTMSMRKLLIAFSSERGLKGCRVRLCT